MNREFQTLHYPFDLEELPVGWGAAQIVEVALDIQPGFACGKHNKEGIGIPHLRPMNINPRGEIDLHEVRYVATDNPLRLSINDILFNNTNSPAWVGKTAIILDSTEFAFSNHMTRLKMPKGINPEFLAKQLHYLQQCGYFLQQCTKHVNQASISSKFLGKSVPLIIPPADEQQRIVKKIACLQTKSGKVRKALEAIPPLLEKFRQSVLSSAFRGDLTTDWRAKNPEIEPAEKLLERIREERRKRWEEDELAKMNAKGKTPKDDTWKKKYKEPEPVDTTDLPELPEGWCWGPLEILGLHQSGIAYKSKDFTNNGIQVIKLGNLYQGRFDLSRDPTFLSQDHPSIFEGLLKPGDLVISQTGTRFKRDYGNFVIIPDDSEKLVLNQRLLRVRLAEKSLAEWVLYATRLAYYRDFFFSHETGGVNQGNVGIEGVMRGPIPFAPYHEMKAILKQLGDITKYTEDIEAIAKKEAINLAQLDQSILNNAFRGELVPQNPKDEPASVLLERIKQENASIEPGTKKKVRRGRTAKKI